MTKLDPELRLLGRLRSKILSLEHQLRVAKSVIGELKLNQIPRDMTKEKIEEWRKNELNT